MFCHHGCFVTKDILSHGRLDAMDVFSSDILSLRTFYGGRFIGEWKTMLVLRDDDIARGNVIRGLAVS
jgi:hypothetical protein